MYVSDLGAVNLLYRFFCRDSVQQGWCRLPALDGVLGAGAPTDLARRPPHPPSEALVTARAQARERGDHAQADAIRAQLRDLGVEVRDTPIGATWHHHRCSGTAAGGHCWRRKSAAVAAPHSAMTGQGSHDSPGRLPTSYDAPPPTLPITPPTASHAVTPK